ncbi:MAG: SDR family NAD(P)-dependent oxidoreductase [Gordonia paraffinivorans]
MTGAGSGIGRAVAVALADACFDVVLVDIDAERLAATADRCRGGGGHVVVDPHDVADRDAVQAHAARVEADLGVPTLVVAAAGTTMVALVENEDDDAARRVLAVNWSGVRNGVEAYLPRMEGRGRGSVVTIGSAFGLRASPLQSAYSASKFAVRGYTESVQTELIRRSSPVRVHCVHPGAVRTAIADDAVYTDDAVRRRTTRVFDRLLPATSPSSAAATILDGVVRGRRRILVGADARLLDLTARVTGGPGQHRLVAAASRTIRPPRRPSTAT